MKSSRFITAPIVLPLMCSGHNRVVGISRMLVKTEWDKAEDWLKKRIDGVEDEE